MRKWMFILVILVVVTYPLSTSINLQLVEVCDNAIDDDGDGMIDLNDQDCECQVAEPISLIPNPSFEEMSCCPNDRGSLHCADTWIQASEATTDYLHTCGWFGWEDLPVPMPLPDGDACIGFRNGRFGNEPNPNWKEYTGACLTSPLKAGSSYKFQFWLGFTKFENSPALNVVFYGSTDCKNLPFGIGNERFGCPLNGEGWVQLDRIFASGSNNWTMQEFNVTPHEDIFAIAIGPDCNEALQLNNPYYFLDDLVLADVKDFELVITPGSHPCDPEFILTLPSRRSASYQWYLDGIALLGETGSSIKADTEGTYQVLIIEEDAGSCKVTKPYVHNVPVIRTRVNQHICDGDIYSYNGRSISETGVYVDTFKTKDFCDSIVEFDAVMIQDIEVAHQAKIFRGESFLIGNKRFDSPINQQVTIKSRLGCDSIVNLDLQYYQVFIPNAISPNGDGINDKFSIHGGEDLIAIKSLSLFNRWGTRVFQGQDFMPDEQLPDWAENAGSEGIYTYVTELLMNDGKLHLISGSVLVIR